MFKTPLFQRDWVKGLPHETNVGNGSARAKRCAGGGVVCVPLISAAACQLHDRCSLLALGMGQTQGQEFPYDGHKLPYDVGETFTCLSSKTIWSVHAGKKKASYCKLG